MSVEAIEPVVLVNLRGYFVTKLKLPVSRSKRINTLNLVQIGFTAAKNKHESKRINTTDL